MRRLLFVDDEVSILRALERMLRAHRKDWECHFIDDPARALDALDDVAPDAIVSDMLMPGMDGAEFLTEAARRRPLMARFILSGEVGGGALVRMARAAHQCLMKPCRGDVLLDVLRQALVDPAAVTIPAVLAGVYGCHGLPVAAALCDDLQDLLSQPASEQRDTQAVIRIESSAAMASRVLQVATWTRLGLGTAPAHVHDAYFQLGAERVLSLIDTDLLRPLASTETSTFQHDVWRRCEQVTAVARRIAAMEGLSSDDAGQAALVAMWQTSAPLLLDAVCRDDYAALRQDPSAAPGPLSERERAHFGLSAAEVLALVLRLWGLPALLSEWVAHGDDETALIRDPRGPAGLAHLARLVTATLAGGAPTPASLDQLARIGAASRFDAWCNAGARVLDAEAA